MKLITQLLLILVISVFAHSTYGVEFVSIDKTAVLVCPAVSENYLPALFNAPECKEQSAMQINPQNRAIWIKAHIQLGKEYLEQALPTALYVYGKSASKVYFNGNYLGKNGLPGISSKTETPGKMDKHFYLPKHLLKPDENVLVMYLSAHHGFIDLAIPMHFIGIGAYQKNNLFFQKQILIALPFLGALIMGALYFWVLSLKAGQQSHYRLFALMALFSAGQLFAELSRGMFNYSYPVHDIRLMLLVVCALGFGLSLFFYSQLKFNQLSNQFWSVLTVSFTLASVVLIKGFDGKTVMAILMPTLCAIAMITHQYWQQKNVEQLHYLFVFSCFMVTIVLTFNRFHDLLFYCIITAMLAFLFIQQARQFVKEQTLRKADAEQITKLQLKLTQINLQQRPEKLTIKSMGKTELIAVDTIIYCQAAGDYVEIYLTGPKSTLYSGSLKKLISDLPDTFLKVHRSYLVNSEHIQSLHSINSGAFLKLTDGVEIPVSRRLLPQIRGVIKVN